MGRALHDWARKNTPVLDPNHVSSLRDSPLCLLDPGFAGYAAAWVKLTRDVSPGGTTYDLDLELFCFTALTVTIPQFLIAPCITGIVEYRSRTRNSFNQASGGGYDYYNCWRAARP